MLAGRAPRSSLSDRRDGRSGATASLTRALKALDQWLPPRPVMPVVRGPEPAARRIVASASVLRIKPPTSNRCERSPLPSSGGGWRRAGSCVDLLGQRAHSLGEGVDLLGHVGVLLEQVGLILVELLSMLRRRLFVGLVCPRLRLLGDDHERARIEGNR